MQTVVDPAQLQAGAATWVYLVVIGVFLPVAAIRQNRSLASGTLPSPTRGQVYFSAIATHVGLFLMTWIVARIEHVDLLPSYRIEGRDVVIGLIALVSGLVLLLDRFRSKDPVARERTRLIAPRARRDFALFYVVAATAGVSEELAYRGLLFTAFAAISGSWWIGAVLSAACFGVVHVFQGWRSAGLAALMGLCQQIVAGLTGTLLIPMATHFAHDVIAGTVIGIRARRESAP